MGSFTIGISLQPQHTTAASMLEAFKQADEMGVDAIYVWDHFFPLSGDPDGVSFEAWTVLTACGMQTKRAKIGSLVHGIGYRNPALLSYMAKTLDHFLGGRAVLGLGAGWFERDYTEYGFDFGTPGSRLKDLERSIEIIKERWEKDVPKPVQTPIPILIGGAGQKVTLRITAQQADIWHSFGTADEWSEKNRVLTDWCGKVGRDPGAIERSASVFAAARDNADEFAAGLDERIPPYLAAGATDLMFGIAPPYDLAPVQALIEWRAKHG